MPIHTAEVYKIEFETQRNTKRILIGYTTKKAQQKDKEASNKRLNEHKRQDAKSAAWCFCAKPETLEVVNYKPTYEGIKGLFLELRWTLDEIKKSKYMRCRGAFICTPTVEVHVVKEVDKLLALDRKNLLTEDWALSLTSDAVDEFPLTTAHLWNLCFYCRQKGHKFKYCPNKNAAKSSSNEGNDDYNEEEEEKDRIAKEENLDITGIKIYHHEQRDHWYFRREGVPQVSFHYQEVPKDPTRDSEEKYYVFSRCRNNVYDDATTVVKARDKRKAKYFCLEWAYEWLVERKIISEESCEHIHFFRVPGRKKRRVA